MHSFGQSNQRQSDSLLQGDIHGLVKDSALNFYFQAASIAVYQGENKELVSYSLTNSLGEFRVKRLPLEKTLYLSVGYIGYKAFELKFRLSKEVSSFNAGTVYLKKDTSTLEEVVVTNSPVRMHGDTLEFSAGAFALEKNAVAEDLLKVLPGIIIWGDGLITINGRPINKLLVDGKPFFGGDTKIALQNIPKSAIERVQVYQESINPYNPFDSLTSINLKLRKDHHSGYFGLASVGIATNSRNESSLANSFFNQKDQFTIVGQTNNTNKLANDIASLLRSTTYKGNGVKVDYQPDFSMEGANKQSSGGVMYTHDFIPVYNETKKNRLDIQSFVNQTINTTNRQSTTISSIGIDSTIFQTNNNLLNTTNTNYLFEGHYTQKTQWDSMSLAASYNGNNISQQGNWQNITQNSKSQLLNTALVSDSLKSSLYTSKLTSAFYHHGFFNTEVRHLTDWSLLYELIVGGNNQDRLRSSFLNSILTPSQNASYYRSFAATDSRIHNSLSFSLGNFAVALFGNSRFPSRFNMQLMNNLDWDIHNKNDFTADINPSTLIATKNNYLTRDSRATTILETPGIRISRAFLNILANRYQKDIVLDIFAKGDIYSESFTNKTNLTGQTFNYSYFTPNIALSYNNNQYGEYLNQFTSNFNTDVKYPKFSQRYLLADSSESYSILNGNPNLKPERRYTVGFGFNHNSYRTKKPISYGAGVRYGLVKNYIGDSVIIDNTGKYFIYPINYNDSKVWEGNFYIRSAIVKGKNQIQFSLKGYFQRLSLPGFIGYKSLNLANATSTSIFIQSDSLSIHYNLGNLLAINLEENISYYNSAQSGSINGGYTNFRIQTLIGAGVNLSNTASLSSNVSFNSYPNLNVVPNKYTIWNASFALRSLKSKNLELKVSALDILRQNKGIFISGNSNSFTQGTVNLLQQYYIFTLSYYPRKFEKTKRAK